MSLANKYRPKTWEDVVEQKYVVTILKNLCEGDLTNRNFLFIGSQGIGKTTLARIVANELNGGKGDPIEMDAASHSGVDSVREIVQQAHSYPVGCKYKVFILDEVHSFSNAAWQALLTTLEEMPAKSVFALCTTNPEKIPATILSRVQTFQLSKISLEGVTSRLKYVLDAEIESGQDIEYTEEAVQFIAKLSKGGMRDALTLLDKVLAYSNKIDADTISVSLNLPHYDDYFDLLSAYAKKDNVKIANVIHNVYNSGINFAKWFEEFHSFVMNVVKFILLQDIRLTMIPIQYEEKISKYGSSHAAICLNLANKLITLNHELKYTSYMEEVALTHLCRNSKKG